MQRWPSSSDDLCMYNMHIFLSFYYNVLHQSGLLELLFSGSCRRQLNGCLITLFISSVLYAACAIVAFFFQENLKPALNYVCREYSHCPYITFIQPYNVWSYRELCIYLCMEPTCTCQFDFVLMYKCVMS